MHLGGKNYSIKDENERIIGEWYHIAAVVKENQGSSEVNIYENGVLIKEITSARLLGDIEGKPWTLGQEWDSKGKSDFFSGQMDEVRIWNYARTEVEINADQDSRITGKEAGLVGYWHFDGLTAKDYSGNGNNGTIYYSATH
ncbi:MAG: LamG domain-containing protein [Okeania sp. SIO2F4]|uniref:LamG domain-containing protein n=1 Tax=Okeania sp. SIO2F4 TaxID=2607790 RepID=UPI00142C68A8|nr:LamG domain-containing protein [Okeania sp. SIO2F4]NES07148.1 LamG domain-containing protein [Okeania sp. SIO2F4]